MAQDRFAPVNAPTKGSVGREAACASRPMNGVQATILFTGNRHNDHYEVIIRGEEIELPLACYRALIKVVLARSGPGQGFVTLTPVTVCRLRKAIDNVLGAGTGKSLIETGNAVEYRLALPHDHLRASVAVSACFQELVELAVISPESAMELRQITVK